MTPNEATAIDYLDHDLDRDEGTVAWVYLDTLGFQTIGRGILVDRRKGGRLLPEEIAFINQNRMKRILADCRTEVWFEAVRDDPVRLAAVMNMQFQMGEQVDEKFANSYAAIARKDWKAAAAGMRQSLWAKQTPARAERVIRAIETGKRT